MGKIVQLTCPTCQKTWKLRTGHGLMHATLDHILFAFPQEMQDQIRRDAGLPQGPSAASAGSLQRHSPAFEFQYCPFLCPTCRRPVAVPVLRLQDPNAANPGSTGDHIYIGPCPDCGALVHAAEEGSDILCPDCGLAVLTMQTVGSWD